jgi:hypothetical protein
MMRKVAVALAALVFVAGCSNMTAADWAEFGAAMSPPSVQSPAAAAQANCEWAAEAARQRADAELRARLGNPTNVQCTRGLGDSVNCTASEVPVGNSMTAYYAQKEALAARAACMAGR